MNPERHPDPTDSALLQEREAHAPAPRGRIWIEAAPEQGAGVFFRLGDPGAQR